MKFILAGVLLFSFISCAHKPQKITVRIPASATIPNLEEFITAYKNHLNKKQVPVGFEVVEKSLKNGLHDSKKRIYLKQNKHGYYELLWHRNSEGKLWSHNFNVDGDEFEKNIRATVAEGRILSISGLDENIFELKTVRDDAQSKQKIACTLVFNFNQLLRNEVCVNDENKVVYEVKETARQVQLANYEYLLRDARITICSNTISRNDNSTCFESRAQIDWWRYLFEKNNP